MSKVLMIVCNLISAIWWGGMFFFFLMIWGLSGRGPDFFEQLNYLIVPGFLLILAVLFLITSIFTNRERNLFLYKSNRVYLIVGLLVWLYYSISFIYS